MHKPYNFVWNIYEEFAPDHLKRIKDAVAYLPSPSERTGLSFAHELNLDKPDSGHDSRQAPS